MIDIFIHFTMHMVRLIGENVDFLQLGFHKGRKRNHSMGESMNKKLENFKGRKKQKGAKFPLKLEHYQEIRKLIRIEEKRYTSRNLLLINMQVNTSLRSCDVLKMTVGDVYKLGRFLEVLRIEQTKTKKQTVLHLIECILHDLRVVKKQYPTLFGENYFENPKNPLFPSYQKGKDKQLKPIAYSTYHSLLKNWVLAIGLNPDLYGTHSMRVSLPLHYFRNTNNLDVTGEMLGHINRQTTVGYVKRLITEKTLEAREEYHFYD